VRQAGSAIRRSVSRCPFLVGAWLTSAIDAVDGAQPAVSNLI